ncbi:MAG: serine/threonine protein kinase, partial [Myxococcales bacterium]|nr:serine/threonine protein kinase [Myxococcales bacterium]
KSESDVSIEVGRSGTISVAKPKQHRASLSDFAANEGGQCPSCGAEGLVGEPCSHRVCSGHEIHIIPTPYADLYRERLAHSPFPDLLVGRRIHDYLVVDTLGSGSVGRVFCALQLPVLMRVALKISSARHVASRDSALHTSHFVREAKILARLRHPHIVTLMHYGVFQALPFIVTDLVEPACTLRDELRRRTVEGESLRFSEVRGIVEQILDALYYAHSEFVVHRDIKPENVLLQRTPGTNRIFVRVLDFGLAKVVRESHETNYVSGTAIYMAPEQILGSEIGPWTDLYAVAVMLSELITGSCLFAGMDRATVYRLKLGDGGHVARALSDHALPPEALEFFRVALARAPSERQRDVTQFREQMERMFDALEVGGKTELSADEISRLLQSRVGGLTQSRRHSPSISDATVI